MKYYHILVLSLSSFLLSAFTINEITAWKLTDDYEINFSTKKVSGSFETFMGEIFFDEDNLAGSKCDLRIEVASIKTGNFLKTRHAKGSNWFDAGQYPIIQFVSSSFNTTSLGFEASGVLDMHGVKQEITIPFSFNNNVFETSFVVDRTDFGVGGVKGLQGKVGLEVRLDIRIPVVRE